MLLRLVVLMALVLCVAAPAWGQTTFAEMVAPALSREDYRVIVSRLGLSEEQREAADQLYEGYDAEHVRNVKAYKQAWKDDREATKVIDGERVEDPAANEALSAAIKRYAEAKPGAQKSLLRDLRSLLDEAQAAEHWPGVERFIRRQLMDKLSHRGVVEWQRADLIRGVRLLELAPDDLAKVQPLLEEYELLIDKPLRRMEPLVGVEGDDAQRGWNDAVLELSSTNRRYLRLITQEIPQEAGVRLNRWARDLAYWLLHWNGYSTRIGIEDAKKLATFSAEQRAKADALWAEMEKQTAELRKQAEPEFDEADEKMRLLSDREWKEAMSREDSPSMTVQRRWGERYDEIYLGFEERLVQILTPEQRREAWPPNGSLRDAMIARSRKIWE